MGCSIQIQKNVSSTMDGTVFPQCWFCQASFSSKGPHDEQKLDINAKYSEIIETPNAPKSPPPSWEDPQDVYKNRFTEVCSFKQECGQYSEERGQQPQEKT
jgi:hypothetical protein